MKRMKRSGIIDSNEIEDKPVIQYCPHCLEFGFMYSKLGLQLYRHDEPIPSDHDEWLQCHACGNIYPVYEAKIESKIQDFTQVTDNPFDQGKNIVGLGNISKAKKTPLQKRIKRLKDSIDREKDPDIKQELRRGNQVTIIEDTSYDNITKGDRKTIK